MTLLKMMAHFLAGISGMFLGMGLWLAPHLDWSAVKDESLFSTRGLVVLAMTCICFVTNIMAMFYVVQQDQQRRKLPY